jgi:hypothetical protein
MKNNMDKTQRHENLTLFLLAAATAAAVLFFALAFTVPLFIAPWG